MLDEGTDKGWFSTLLWALNYNCIGCGSLYFFIRIEMFIIIIPLIFLLVIFLAFFLFLVALLLLIMMLLLFLVLIFCLLIIIILAVIILLAITVIILLVWSFIVHLLEFPLYFWVVFLRVRLVFRFWHSRWYTFLLYFGKIGENLSDYKQLLYIIWA